MSASSATALTPTRWFWKSSQDSRPPNQKGTSSSILNKTSDVFRAFRTGSRIRKLTNSRPVADDVSTSSSSDLSVTSSSSSYSPRREQQERPPPTISITATSHSSQNMLPVHSSISSGSSPSTARGSVSTQKRFRFDGTLNRTASPAAHILSTGSTSLGPSSGEVMRKNDQPQSERRYRSQTVGGQTLNSISTATRGGDLSRSKRSALRPPPADHKEGVRARVLSGLDSGTPTSDYSNSLSPAVVANDQPRQQPSGSSVISRGEPPESKETLIALRSTHRREFSIVSVSSVDYDISRRLDSEYGEPYAQSILDEKVPFRSMNPEAQGSPFSFGWEPSAERNEPQRMLRAESQIIPRSLFDEIAPPAVDAEDSYPPRLSSTSALSVDSNEVFDTMLKSNHEFPSTQPPISPSIHPSKLSSFSSLVPPSLSKSSRRVPVPSSSLPIALSPVTYGLRKQRSLAPLTPAKCLLEVERPALRHYSSVGTSPSPQEKISSRTNYHSTDAPSIGYSQRDFASASPLSMSVNGAVEGSTPSISSSRPLSPASITSIDVDGLPVRSASALDKDKTPRLMPSIGAVATSATTSVASGELRPKPTRLVLPLNTAKLTSSGEREDEESKLGEPIVSRHEVALLLEAEPGPEPNKSKRSHAKRRLRSAGGGSSVSMEKEFSPILKRGMNVNMNMPGNSASPTKSSLSIPDSSAGSPERLFGPSPNQPLVRPRTTPSTPDTNSPRHTFMLPRPSTVGSVITGLASFGGVTTLIESGGSGGTLNTVPKSLPPPPRSRIPKPSVSHGPGAVRTLGATDVAMMPKPNTITSHANVPSGFPPPTVVEVTGPLVPRTLDRTPSLPSHRSRSHSATYPRVAETRSPSARAPVSASSVSLPTSTTRSRTPSTSALSESTSSTLVVTSPLSPSLCDPPFSKRLVTISDSGLRPLTSITPVPVSGKTKTPEQRPRPILKRPSFLSISSDSDDDEGANFLDLTEDSESLPPSEKDEVETRIAIKINARVPNSM